MVNNNHTAPHIVFLLDILNAQYLHSKMVFRISYSFFYALCKIYQFPLYAFVSFFAYKFFPSQITIVQRKIIEKIKLSCIIIIRILSI